VTGGAEERSSFFYQQLPRSVGLLCSHAHQSHTKPEVSQYRADSDLSVKSGVATVTLRLLGTRSTLLRPLRDIVVG
jgi:hypothetical protein